MRRFGLDWEKSDEINEVSIYQRKMNKDDFTKFTAKKGYTHMKVGFAERQIAPKGYEFNSAKVSIFYKEGVLTLAVNKKG